MKAFLSYIFLVSVVFFFEAALGVEEGLGRLAVTDLTLKPYFLLSEPQQGEFGVGDSSVELSWGLGQNVLSHFRIGPQSLRNTMARFDQEISEEISIVEAYAQYTSLYGQVRLGLIPINYAAEGSLQERQLFFQRSLFFKKRIIPLRDVGLAYSVSNQGFFSEFAAHNGEGTDNPDGRMWYSAKWGWRDRDKFIVGFSGLTGTTKPESTSDSGDIFAGVDVDKEAKWRMGTFFVKWDPSEWRTLLEITFGELEQEDEVRSKFSGGHIDLIYDQLRWAAMIRYDHLEPDNEVGSDQLKEVSVGVILKTANQTSQWKIIGTKVLEEGANTPNDELRLIWQLTPIVDTPLD